ncbi:hypothetical protein OKW28_005476 [Paraburkholderia sp. 40]
MSFIDVRFALDHRIGRQAAVLASHAHAAARRMKAHADSARGHDAVVETAAVRIDIQMVARRRAARQQQFGHRGQRRYFDHVRREVRPHLVQVREPAEQLGVLRGGNRAREALVHVVMRVDEARNHEMAVQVEYLVGRLRQLRGRSDRDDPVVLDIQPGVAQFAPLVIHRDQHVRVLHEHRFTGLFQCFIHRHSSVRLIACMQSRSNAMRRHATVPSRSVERHWPGYPA